MDNSRLYVGKDTAVASKVNGVMRIGGHRGGGAWSLSTQSRVC